MSEAKMKADVTAGFATPPFHPILTDAGGGHTFTMLGTTMRLIASAAGSGGRYTVVEQISAAGGVQPRHIHSREDEIFYILEGSYELHVGDERRTFPLVPRRSCPATFHTAFAMWRPRPAVWYSLSLRAD